MPDRCPERGPGTGWQCTKVDHLHGDHYAADPHWALDGADVEFEVWPQQEKVAHV